MTEPFQNFDELRGLLELLCEERLPAEKMSRLEELVQAEFLNGVGNGPVQQVGGEVTFHQIVLRPAVQGLHGNLLAPLAGQQHHWTALRV